jgi:hypothetical protein
LVPQERYKRGSKTQEHFHKNDKKSGGHDTTKTFRQPLKQIQYSRPGKINNAATYYLE